MGEWSGGWDETERQATAGAAALNGNRTGDGEIARVESGSEGNGREQSTNAQEEEAWQI
jgi:hypothetical protein